MNKKTTGIILIAGNSTRYWKNSNKNFEMLLNKPVVQYSLEIFNENPNIDEIILVVRDNDRNIIWKILKDIKQKKDIKLVTWWSSRQESVYNALIEASWEIVFIHDWARPLVKHEFINNLILEMRNYNWASVWVKSKDTIKITNDFWEVINTTNRSNTWLIQTPQCFDKFILLEAHNAEKLNPSITDDCMLMEIIWERVKLIEWDYTNIKVTTSWDISILEQFLKNNI